MQPAPHGARVLQAQQPGRPVLLDRPHRLARERVRAPAQRIGVSEPTLMRMEKGDPSVSMGIYATALWLMGRASALSELAAPVHDLGALEDAVRAAKARSVRKKPSLYGPAGPAQPEENPSP